MENSGWTWLDGAGRRYEVWRIPCLWRRATDYTPAEAASLYGPCGTPGEPASHWAELHARLTGVAELWGPADAAGVEAFRGKCGIPPSPAIEVLSSYARGLLAAGEVGIGIHYPWSGPVVTYSTLRAYLTSQALNQCEFAPRHHRCQRCGEWHEVMRAGARFCGAACRVGTHRTGQRTAFDQQSDRDG